MKLKYYIYLIIILLYSCNMEYVEFKPIEQKNNKFIINEQVMSSQFNKNLKRVLDFYMEDYKIEETKIFINSRLWKDKDLMWNYTNKAKNKEWLKTH